MKFATTFALLLFFLSNVSGQSVSYSIDCPRPDSCFLKEISTGARTLSEPRPQTMTSYTLFKTISEYDAIVSRIRKQAADELAKGMEQVNRANAMNAVADKIEAVKPKSMATKDATAPKN